MKKYRIQISATIYEGDDSIYSPVKALTFDVKEPLPVNTDAQKYLRARLGEEIARQFRQLAEPIDNFTDEAKQAIDPLEQA